MAYRRLRAVEVFEVTTGLLAVVAATWYGVAVGSVVEGGQLFVGMLGLGLLHFALSGGGWKVWLAILALALLGGILLSVSGPFCSSPSDSWRCN